MAGESGHNLRIARSRLGSPRFPFERSDVGDGYAAAGPITVRQMTPEERARYGPPVAPKDRDLGRGEAAFVVDNAASLEHAARIARVSVAKMKNEIARHCVAVPEGWKEGETMNDIQGFDNPQTSDTIEQGVIESPENKGFEVFDKTDNSYTTEQDPPAFCESTSGRRFTAERIARAEKSLSREEYVRLKNEGVTDLKIKKTKGFSGDLMVALKKKWGLEDLNLRKAPPRKASAKPPEEPKTDTVLPAHTEESKEALRTRAVAVGLTITQALQLRVELTEDIDSLNRILDVAQRGAELTDRVVQMLTWYRDSYRQHLERIEEVFSRTVVQL